MKNNLFKGISAVLLVFLLMVASFSTAYAETVQDQIQNYINEALKDYESAETEEEQEDVQQSLDEWLADNGFGSIDLGSIAESDIGSIVSGLMGDTSILDSLGGVGSLITDAFNSGLGMITDAIGGGLGTSDGSNTATTQPATSPNVIIADDTTKEQATQAVGVPNISTRPSSTTQPVTSEPTTYNVGNNVSGNLVGSGVTTTVADDANSVVQDDAGSAVMVLIILSAATLVVIVAIIVFFLMKRRY